MHDRRRSAGIEAFRGRFQAPAVAYWRPKKYMTLKLAV
jgi:hypothetical protein